jgi:hypothetical protein
LSGKNSVLIFETPKTPKEINRSKIDPAKYK